ncbi:MAG: NAD(P)-dependent alcohol dehydrogenase [Pseudomonadota bacterium]
MRALTYTRYGGPEVVAVTEVPQPKPAKGEILVQVEASAVNTGDWRIRAAAFPGILAIPGRLMFGLTRPRRQALGTEFAGVVAALGPGATRFQVGDAVFGFASGGGASAEYLSIAEEGAVALRPAGLSAQEAAALPFGGLCALAFLSDFAGLQPGQSVLIVGASGGVGCYAVQVAKALGATVAGVAGPDSQAFLTSLGVDVAYDYSATSLRQIEGPFDVVFDAVGAASPQDAWHLLREGGLFLPLNFGLREIGAALTNPLRRRKIRLAVNDDTAEALDKLSQMVTAGTLRPIIDTVFPLDEARAAHAKVETRHRQGAIVLSIAEPKS